MVFTSDRKRNKQIDTRIEKQTEYHGCFTIPWSQNESFLTPQSFVFKSVFVPILTYGHESWIMSEIILSEVQAAEMGFLRRNHGATLCDKVRSCEIHNAVNVEPLLRIQRS